MLALAVGIAVSPLLRSGNDVGAGPSPSANTSPSPAPIRDGPLPAGTYAATPFPAAGSDAGCLAPPQPGCREVIADDDIRFTLTVPDGWSGSADGA